MEKNILILAEHLKGQVSDITFEMLGKAREISGQAGGKVWALVYGNKIDNLAQQLGAADEVLYCDNDNLSEFLPETYTALTLQKINELKPWLVLTAATSMGLDVSSIISAKIDIPLFASCRDFQLEGDKLILTNQLYGGKMLIETEFAGAQAVVSVLPGTFRAEKGKSEKPAVVKKFEYKIDGTIHSKFERMVEPESGDVDITQIPVLVSVGRGIQSKDNVPLAEELAEVMGGAVSASRPVVDQGWLATTRQVGRSGMTVKPKLYLALGISGAPEHVEGMKDSELIIAVNTDPKAPIFNIAQYGVVADALEIIPLLKDAVAARKG
jgi:electron transfer flavoprotein alpha subunit